MPKDMTTIPETTFTKILEAADHLQLEDQEDLIRILQNRLRDRRRAELIQDVQEAQQEFALGECKPVTPAQLMEELLAWSMYYCAPTPLSVRLEKPSKNNQN